MKEEAKARWSSRKFWAAMAWQAILTLLVIFDTIPDSTFESLTYLILGGYFLSNVAQKGLQKGKDTR